MTALQWAQPDRTGDLHPFIAVALRLCDAGFEPVIATGKSS